MNLSELGKNGQQEIVENVIELHDMWNALKVGEADQKGILLRNLEHKRNI